MNYAEMSAREMLELAAKVAVIETRPEYCKMEPGYGLNLSPGYYWNPLERNADAFSLAIRLGLDVDIHNVALRGHRDRYVEVRGFANRKLLWHQLVGECESMEAFTRLAIVRAAIEMGRTMNQ